MAKGVPPAPRQPSGVPLCARCGAGSSRGGLAPAPAASSSATSTTRSVRCSFGAEAAALAGLLLIRGGGGVGTAPERGMFRGVVALESAPPRGGGSGLLTAGRADCGRVRGEAVAGEDWRRSGGDAGRRGGEEEKKEEAPVLGLDGTRC
mmetsp:Transcript_9098/g.29909  ORF Transcript_9098/g.29909 Transcript_9098/m.29909 type:complete len:149 (+) Transcript_9098:84-530(+)